MTRTVYLIDGSSSWHTTTACQALDTARLTRLGTPTSTTNPGGRPACIVCADNATEWIVTAQNFRELYELIGPSKPHSVVSPETGRLVVDGLTIQEHDGLPRTVARFGDSIRATPNGRWTVHPATKEQP